MVVSTVPCAPPPPPPSRPPPRPAARGACGGGARDGRPPDPHRPAERLPLPPALPAREGRLPHAGAPPDRAASRALDEVLVVPTGRLRIPDFPRRQGEPPDEIPPKESDRLPGGRRRHGADHRRVFRRRGARADRFVAG